MKATKKPIEIDFYPVSPDYIDSILKWSSGERPIVITTTRAPKKDQKILSPIQIKEVSIKTEEGEMKAHQNVDVIIKGVEGEVYPCKLSIFKKTYTLRP